MSHGRGSGWSAAALTRAAAAGYLVSAALCCVLAVRSTAHLVDLQVYRAGGRAVLDGARLYRVQFAGLRFTYPPFAAVVFTIFAALPWTAAEGLVTVGSAVALPVTLYLALRLAPVRSWLTRGAALRLALLAGAAAIWLEPVRSTLGFGQVNLFLAAAVLYDLNRPDTARLKGVAIGLAAGIKLTPAIFVVYLLATRRYRAAAVATATFAATAAFTFAVLPADSARFWTTNVVNPGRISPVQDDLNQSLFGALARTLHTPHVTLVWLPVAVVIGLIAMALAVRAQRAGNEAAGFSLCAIAGLLISPISWTHHWTIAVPALLLAAVMTWHRRVMRTAVSPPATPAASPAAAQWQAAAAQPELAEHPAERSAGQVQALAQLPAVSGLQRSGTLSEKLKTIGATVAIAVVVVICWARVTRRVQSAAWLHLGLPALITSEIYVIFGLVAVAVAAWPVLRGWFSRYGGETGRARQPS